VVGRKLLSILIVEIVTFFRENDAAYKAIKNNGDSAEMSK
jgi:hypothetical protein